MTTRFPIQRLAGTVVVTVPVRNLDAGVSRHLADTISDAADEGTPLVVDLSAVEFIDTSGLGALCAARRRLGRGRCRLAGVSERLAPGLGRVPAHRLPPWYASLAEALAGLREAPFGHEGPDEWDAPRREVPLAIG